MATNLAKAPPEETPPESSKEPASPPENEKKPLTVGQRLRAVGRKAALLGLSLLFAGCMGEVAIRITGKHFESSLHTPDPVLGWSFRANARGWSTLEGRAYITVNSDGNRDVEHAVEKPKDTLRIAAIGDSFTANYNLPLEQSWWKVLETRLNECPALGGRKVEVLGFGAGGYGTGQELLMLRQRVWKYQPDIVLLQFFGGNDVLDNKREVMTKKANEPPFFLLQDGQLVLDDSFKNRLPGPTALAVRNTFADVMNHIELLLLLKLAAGARERSKSHVVDSHPKDLGLPDRLSFQPPTDPNMVEAWRVTEALLHQMITEVKAKGAELRMMAVSSPQQTHPDLQERADFLKELKIDSAFYVEERLTKLAEKEGVFFSNLPPRLADYAAQNHVHVHGFPNGIPWGGHWNELGHRLAGEWIAADYCKLLASPKPAGAAP
jgi:lysophospholipase L1-like esterase